MKPGDRAHWLQHLVLLMLVTSHTCRAVSPSERRWEKADLIVEGRIIETTTENGVQISTLSIDRILKTETLVTQPYSKGYVESLTLQIPANTLTQNQIHTFFLEENQGIYRLIATEKIDNPAQAPSISPTFGLLMLILLALIASKRPMTLPENQE